MWYALSPSGRREYETHPPKSKNLKSSSSREQLMKGDIPMGKIFTMAVAIVMLTASWGSAGNFEALADAGAVRAPTPLYIKPGTLIKAEFKSNLRTTSDMDADSLFPEKVSSRTGPKVKPRPAVAFRQRAAGGMAPPPKVKHESPANMGTMAESLEQAVEMEEDLDKDLVIEPPPVKVDDVEGTVKKPQEMKKPAREETGSGEQTVKETVIPEKLTQKKKASQLPEPNASLHPHTGPRP
jgi:hypothetical protein